MEGTREGDSGGGGTTTTERVAASKAAGKHHAPPTDLGSVAGKRREIWQSSRAEPLGLGSGVLPAEKGGRGEAARRAGEGKLRALGSRARARAWGTGGDRCRGRAAGIGCAAASTRQRRGSWRGARVEAPGGAAGPAGRRTGGLERGGGWEAYWLPGAAAWRCHRLACQVRPAAAAQQCSVPK